VRFPSELLFEVGAHGLEAGARPQLDALTETLIRYPRTQLLVTGYTDATGPESLNLTLSYRRAEAVRSYLAEAGIDPNRIEIAGYGPARPIASNDTARGRKANRRVEFLLRHERAADARWVLRRAS